MRITIKKIADLCGVSRGTVDRVINNRPGVNPETADKIRSLLKEFDYKPNAIGKALVALKNPLRLGMILTPLYNPFVCAIQKGALKAAEEFRLFGVNVTIKAMRTLQPEEQVSIIEDMIKRGTRAIALLPIESPLVEASLARAISLDVSVLTFNSDLPSIERLCFVGQEHLAGGRVAGNLMGKLVGEGKVAVITSSQHILCHTQRIAGFNAALGERYARIRTLPAVENEDRDDLTFGHVSALLKGHPDLRGIYLTGGGSAGLGRALHASGTAGLVRVIAHDLVQETVRLIESGVIDFTIGQDPVAQGYLPLKILYSYLSEGVLPAERFVRTRIDIRTLGNLDEID